MFLRTVRFVLSFAFFCSISSLFNRSFFRPVFRCWCFLSVVVLPPVRSFVVRRWSLVVRPVASLSRSGRREQKEKRDGDGEQLHRPPHTGRERNETIARRLTCRNTQQEYTYALSPDALSTVFRLLTLPTILLKMYFSPQCAVGFASSSESTASDFEMERRGVQPHISSVELIAEIKQVANSWESKYHQQLLNLEKKIENKQNEIETGKMELKVEETAQSQNE